MKNINSKEYWDFVYQQEGGIKTWRTSPQSFGLCCKLAGTQQKIIEIGGGVGFLANRLAKMGNHVMMLDISQFAVDECNNNFSFPDDGSGMSLIAYQAQCPPIPMYNIDFDLGVALEILEHYHYPEGLVKEMARVCKRIIVAVPNDHLPNKDCKEHYQRFTDKTFREMLERHFKHVTIHKIVDDWRPSPQMNIICPVLMAECANDESLMVSK